MHIEIDSAMG